MPTEKIAVAIPGQGTFVVDVVCKPSDGDDEIALRMASGFPPGSIFSISGVKWKSVSKNPPKVVELKPDAPEPEVEAPPPSPRRYPKEAVLEAAKTVHVRPEDVSAASEPHKVSEPQRRLEEPAEKAGPLPTTVLASPPPIEPGTYAPGQQWRPKDPRRKSGFTIKAVTEKEVVADDGRTIQLERMKRYDRVS